MKRQFFLIFLICLAFAPLTVGVEMKENAEKSNETGDSQIEEKPSCHISQTSRGDFPGAEALRDAAFQEKNPDFSFPARKTRYFYHGDRDAKLVALSFDDGPNPRYTIPLLEILGQKKVPATFFVTGKNAELYPHIVREIVRSGCEVGNHSYSHPNLRKLSPEKIREELEKTCKAIQNACEITPWALRLPYGISSEQVARTAFNMKLDIFFWSIDTDDWKNDVTKEMIVEKVLNDVKGGSIILMHDKSQKVIDAVKEIIDPIREKGYEFVTCSDLAAGVRRKTAKEKPTLHDH